MGSLEVFFSSIIWGGAKENGNAVQDFCNLVDCVGENCFNYFMEFKYSTWVEVVGNNVWSNDMV